MQSILNIEAPGEPGDEQAPQSRLPWVWVGYLFALAFFVVGVALVLLGQDEEFKIVLVLIAIAGSIYWLFCVHRFHKVLAEITSGRYPIEPSTAVGYHFVPFYNFYWVFKWSASLASYLNERGRVRIINGYLIGLLLMVGMILRFIDGAVGLAVIFTTTLYIGRKLRRHVEQLKGTSQEMLPPPPPDSSVFRQQETHAEQQQPRREMPQGDF